MAEIADGQIHLPNNRGLYRMMRKVAEIGWRDNVLPALDPYSILAAAQARGYGEKFLEQVGGELSLKLLMKINPDPAMLGSYMENVLRADAKVSAYRMLRSAVDNFHASTSEMTRTEMVDHILGFMAPLSSLRQSPGLSRIGMGVDAVLAEAGMNAARGFLTGVWVKRYPKLMDVLHGLRRKRMNVLFARSKVGKSTHMANMATDLTRQDIPGLYLDSEMSRMEQASRVLSMVSGVPEHMIESGRYLSDEMLSGRLGEAAATVRGIPLYYVNISGKSIDYIRKIMEDFRASVGTSVHGGMVATNPCCVFYDWLKVPVGQGQQQMKEYQILGQIATMFKDSLKELDMPGVVGAQANREGIEKSASAKAVHSADGCVSGSDQILMFCDALILARRLGQEEQAIADRLPKPYRFNQMLHVLDQRAGRACPEGICYDLDGPVLTYHEREYVNLKHFDKTGEIINSHHAPEREKKAAGAPKPPEQMTQEDMDCLLELPG
jgi:replicative DNA helicase